VEAAMVTSVSPWLRDWSGSGMNTVAIGSIPLLF
jgi:hypothetical protein